MEIYYCEKCSGRPYTLKLKSGAECPECGSLLRYEDVSDESLASRRKLVYPKSGAPDIQGLLKRGDRSGETVFGSQFIIPDGEIFYEYLGFEKTGTVDFTVRFIFGNQPDENSVITKTPFISPKIKFMQTIELSELELARKNFEKQITESGFEKDNRLFHAFVKRGDDVLVRRVTETFSDITLTADDCFSERYFIGYDFQGFGEINIRPPFSREPGIFDEVRRVLDSRYEKYMDYMIFRARNGDNMNLKSFADDSAVLFDNPHVSLIRYDRLLKEAKATRM